MADILRELNKALLLEVAEEFDTNLPPKCTIKDIRNAVLDLILRFEISIERIMSEAEERKNIAEQEKLAEQARLEKLAEQERLDKLAEQERLDKLAEQKWLDKIAEREVERERERLEKQAEGEFEFEKSDWEMLPK